MNLPFQTYFPRNSESPPPIYPTEILGKTHKNDCGRMMAGKWGQSDPPWWSLQWAGAQMGEEGSGVGCSHWEPGSGQRRNKVAQNWEGAGLFPNLGMQWGHMPVTKTMEGRGHRPDGQEGLGAWGRR